MASILLECGHAVSEVEEVDGEARCGACESEARASDSGVELASDATTALPDASATDAPSDEERPDTEDEEGAEALAPPQPAFGTRNTEPGPRGCWALNARGEPCASFKRRDGDFCTAHTGLGIGTDPKRWSGEAHAARKEQLATRATLRLAMGDRGRIGPRAVLREAVNRQATRLVGTTISAALSPETDPVKAAHIAMRLIETADPPSQTTLTVSAEADVESLSLGQLMALAEQRGIDLTRPAPIDPPIDLPALSE